MVAEKQLVEFRNDIQQRSKDSLAGRRVLFISYNGMMEPLGQSQVLPYLRQLATLGVKFTLLSFEKPAAFTPEGLQRCHALKRELEREDIEWHWLRYHQWPSIPATAFDVLRGIGLGEKLITKNRIELVHARSHIPATIGLALKRRCGVKMIFDVRGLLADEYVDANHWQLGSVAYKITKAMERRALAGADGVVTLTEKIWPLLQSWPGLSGRDVTHTVVPCCTSLDLFKFNQESRTRLRSQLGISEKFTFVYSGSIDGWYLTKEMAEFFAFVRSKRSDAHFLWLTPARHERIRELMQSMDIPDEHFTIQAATVAQVPDYLSASDVGIAFIKPCFSKLASSPTKYAEYLACGLPLVINAGIGDSDLLVQQHGAGALLTDFSEREFACALETIERLVANADLMRIRMREIAVQLFDINNVGLGRYSQLYRAVLAA